MAGPIDDASHRARAESRRDAIRLDIVEGEGIGPEVSASAVAVMQAATELAGAQLVTRVSEPVTQRNEWGFVLDGTIRQFYTRAFDDGVPVVHGPMGGQYVYQLRREFEVPLKFTPVTPFDELADAAIVRRARQADVDILIVRDNSEGLYQGAFGWNDDTSEAFHEARYSVDAVERVVGAAADVARARTGRLAVVVKPGGVPTISALWRTVAERIAVEDIDLEFIEVDNACFQIVANPARFDVIVAPNLFGDIISDTAATLLGSRGMSYSGNFGAGNRAVFQTAHGAARDLAGTNTANPVAHILTMAWAVAWSSGRSDIRDAIVAAIQRVFARGIRTADIAGPESAIVSTTEMAQSIIDTLDAQLSTGRP